MTDVPPDGRRGPAAVPEPQPATEHPETAAELAGRLRLGFAAGFAMYAAVEATMFAPGHEVCMLPPGPVPARPRYVRPDRRSGAPGAPRVPTIMERVIPDLRITGTATERPGSVVIGDFTLTGTLPDGWSLHLHTRFRCEVVGGLVARYLVQNDPEEFQRLVVALGNPYRGMGVAGAEEAPR